MNIIFEMKKTPYLSELLVKKKLDLHGVFYKPKNDNNNNK